MQIIRHWDLKNIIIVQVQVQFSFIYIIINLFLTIDTTYVLSWLKLTNSKSPEGSPPFAARFMAKWGARKAWPSFPNRNQTWKFGRFFSNFPLTSGYFRRIKTISYRNLLECNQYLAIRRAVNIVFIMKLRLCFYLDPTTASRKNIANAVSEHALLLNCWPMLLRHRAKDQVRHAPPLAAMLALDYAGGLPCRRFGRGKISLYVVL